jgi:hypothetical protein
VIACLFATIVMAALSACARMARAFRLPAIVRVEGGEAVFSRQTSHTSSTSGEPGGSRAIESERTRAAAIAGIMHSTMLRERAELIGAGAPAAPIVRAVEARTTEAETARRAVPLGKSFRRPAARVSATAAKRDKGA